MYSNEIKPEFDETDMSDEQYNILCKELDPKHKEFLAKQFSENIAYYIAIWFKYFRQENTNYERIAASAFDYPKFTDQEIEDYINKSKVILENKYGISITQSDPLILSSEVPFKDINV